MGVGGESIRAGISGLTLDHFFYILLSTSPECAGLCHFPGPLLIAMSQPTRPHPRTDVLDTFLRGACRGRGWGYPLQSDASCPGNVHARVGSQ